MISYIVAIRSRTQVMRCYEFFKSNNINSRVVNTPREASIGCGISVEVDYDSYPRARDLLNKSDYDTFIGWFRCERDGRRMYVVRA